MKLFCRYVFSVLMLALLQQACNQSSSVKDQQVHAQLTESAASTGTLLNHIALYVHELEKSANFYEQVVGLQKIPEPFRDGLHEWFSIGSSQLHLIAGAPPEMQQYKTSHLCFSVSSIDAVIERLEEHGVDYSNWPGDSRSPTVRPDGVKQIYFQDPDGYWIEINNDR